MGDAHRAGPPSAALNEVRLGHGRSGKDTHAYSVAYADYEIDEVISHADKIIFNSVSQLDRFSDQAAGIVRGLRLNPGISSSSFDKDVSVIQSNSIRRSEENKNKIITGK